MTNKQIIIDGLLINYYSVFPEKKSESKVLVFLHGWGVDSTLWFKIAPSLLKKNYSLYFLDLPGFGMSQTPYTDYGLAEYKKIVCEFIKKLGLKNINLIGHSFGGSIAIKTALDNPSFLKKIILVNAAGVRSSSLEKNIKVFFARILKPLFAPSFMQPIRARFYRMIGSEYLDIPLMSKIFAKIVAEDLTLDLPKIAIPTLIITGSDDKDTPESQAKEMNRKIKGSKLVVLPAGHFSFLDAPEEFIKELIENI